MEPRSIRKLPLPSRTEFNFPTTLQKKHSVQPNLHTSISLQILHSATTTGPPGQPHHLPRPVEHEPQQLRLHRRGEVTADDDGREPVHGRMRARTRIPLRHARRGHHPSDAAVHQRPQVVLRVHTGGDARQAQGHTRAQLRLVFR